MPPPESAPVTVLEVQYPARRGTIGIRGSAAPLSWDVTKPPDERIDDRSLFYLPINRGDVVELKLVRNEDAWAAGRNYAIHPGDHLVLSPSFDTDKSSLIGPFELPGTTRRFVYQVLLPPSYEEQERKHYPVLYAVDGQALFSTSRDPFGVWHLDAELDQLYALGAVEEMIVVAIHTGEEREKRLTPMVDPQHGGGEAKDQLEDIVTLLRPEIDKTYRTKRGRRNTGLLGSSLGGLFVFYAAWERPDIFGRAACLSSSFWWAHRQMVRHVQRNPCPQPKPVLYIDSGAPLRPDETNPSLKDGYDHTRAMYRALTDHTYSPGVDLHWLVFTNAMHDPAAWRSRVSIPLQLLFPHRYRRPDEVD